MNCCISSGEPMDIDVPENSKNNGAAAEKENHKKARRKTIRNDDLDDDENMEMKPPKKKRKATIPKSMRIAVWNTYIGETIGKTKCPICWQMDITQMNFHCGHVIAEANGGKVSIENLRPICASCNLSMRTMNMHDFANMYFPRPYQ